MVLVPTLHSIHDTMLREARGMGRGALGEAERFFGVQVDDALEARGEVGLDDADFSFPSLGAPVDARDAREGVPAFFDLPVG
jgi:hypothetical protein